jgi:hypothetical protein
MHELNGILMRSSKHLSIQRCVLANLILERQIQSFFDRFWGDST